jgi:hypothetical protein
MRLYAALFTHSELDCHLDRQVGQAITKVRYETLVKASPSHRPRKNCYGMMVFRGFPCKVGVCDVEAISFL